MDIAVLGYGTVGSGVVHVLNVNADVIAKHAGQQINVKYVLDLRDFPGDPIQEKVVHDYQVILNDPEIKVVAEVMGGLEPAHTFEKMALEAGKSVCTSNKEVVAKYGAELLAIAKANNVNYFFEASVGGGIPIIRPLVSCLTADQINEVSAILNGTTNYMLTKMDEDGADYADVLKEAQALGYAELHPEADVEGYDPCRKIAILSSLVYGKQVDFEDIYTEGITKITSADFAYAKAMNAGIKLIASGRFTEDGLFAKVSPVMLSKNNPLCGIRSVYNGVLVNGNMLDDVMFYGRGAGKDATASAVVTDIQTAVKLSGNEPIIWEAEKSNVLPIDQYESKFFVRVSAQTPQADVKALFGDVEIVAPVEGEYGFVTDQMTVAAFNEKKAALPGFIARLFATM